MAKGKDLGFTGSYIIAKETSLHAVFPLSEEETIQEGNWRFIVLVAKLNLVISSNIVQLLESIQRQL